MPVRGLDESQARRARVGNADLAWIEDGAAPSNEPPLAPVHGFTGPRDDFIGVVPELARRPRGIVAGTRRHENSSTVAGVYGCTFDQLVNDLIDLPDPLEFERCVSHARLIVHRRRLRGMTPESFRGTLADAEYIPHQETPKACYAAVEASLEDTQPAATPLAIHASEGNGP